MKSGKLGGLGLDVHWEEPGDPAKELYRLPNVIAFPHSGGCTVEVVKAHVGLMVSNICRKHEGRELLHELNIAASNRS